MHGQTNKGLTITWCCWLWLHTGYLYNWKYTCMVRKQHNSRRKKADPSQIHIQYWESSTKFDIDECWKIIVNTKLQRQLQKRDNDKGYRRFTHLCAADNKSLSNCISQCIWPNHSTINDSTHTKSCIKKKKTDYYLQSCTNTWRLQIPGYWYWNQGVSMHGKCELSFKDIEWGVFRKYALCIMLDNGLGFKHQG